MSVSLKAEDVRELLRECVTVVQPGEILVLNFDHTNMQDAQRVRDHIRAFNIDNGTALKVLIVAGGIELGVAPDPEPRASSA